MVQLEQQLNTRTLNITKLRYKKKMVGVGNSTKDEFYIIKTSDTRY